MTNSRSDAIKTSEFEVGATYRGPAEAALHAELVTGLGLAMSLVQTPGQLARSDRIQRHSAHTWASLPGDFRWAADGGSEKW